MVNQRLEQHSNRRKQSDRQKRMIHDIVREEQGRIRRWLELGEYFLKAHSESNDEAASSAA